MSSRFNIFVNKFNVKMFIRRPDFSNKKFEFSRQIFLEPAGEKVRDDKQNYFYFWQIENSHETFLWFSNIVHRKRPNPEH